MSLTKATKHFWFLLHTKKEHRRDTQFLNPRTQGIVSLRGDRVLLTKAEILRVTWLQGRTKCCLHEDKPKPSISVFLGVESEDFADLTALPHMRFPPGT